MYFSGNFEDIIEEQESTRDLGVIMQNNASFTIQIDKASSKARQKAGWINRSFYCKQGWFMRHMWNTLVAPHLDYCNQLWAPGEGCGLEKLEKVLKDFTAKVPEVKALNYWLRLKLFKDVLRDIELYMYGRLLKPCSQEMESVWPLKTTERGVFARFQVSSLQKESREITAFKLLVPNYLTAYQRI